MTGQLAQFGKMLVENGMGDACLVQAGAGEVRIVPLRSVPLRVSVCGHCGTSPDSPVARACTSSRCPLVKSDTHHRAGDAA